MSLRDAIGAMMRAVSPHGGARAVTPDDPVTERRGRDALRDTAASVQTAADKITTKARNERDVMASFIHGINAAQQRDVVRRGE